MAKKKTKPRRKTSQVVTPTVATVKEPGKRSSKKKKRTAKKAKPVKGEIVVMDANTATLLPATRRDSLRAWLSLYLSIEEARPDAAEMSNTFKAKKGDLQRFVDYLEATAGDDHPDSWTKSVSKAFVRHFLKAKSERTGRLYKPSTIDRALATLRHAARWVHKQRPFLAGYPMAGIKDVGNSKAPWVGLEDVAVTRMLSAAEQLIQIQTRASQMPRRNYALLAVGLDTALRPFEMLGLSLDQYDGKYFRNVLCKGNYLEDKVPLSKFARDAVDSFIAEERGEEAGPLFCTKNGNSLAVQNYDVALKGIAAQANSRLPKAEHIQVHPHLLRHTSLRRMCQKHGIEYAKQRAHHVSDRHIWRYVQPTEEQFEEAVEGLWD